MMVDIVHFIQVTGEMEAELFADALEDSGIELDDNVVIIDDQIKPMGREEVLYMLEEFARVLDVAEEMDIDWEEVYDRENVT